MDGPTCVIPHRWHITREKEIKCDVLMMKDKMVIDTNSGLLYKISKPKEKSQQIEYQLCVPSIIKPDILILFHDHEVFGGHMSVGKCFYRLSKNFSGLESTATS